MHEGARCNASDQNVVHGAVESRILDAQKRNKCIGWPWLNAALSRIFVVEVTVREVNLFNDRAEIDGESRRENDLAVIFHVRGTVRDTVM